MPITFGAGALAALSIVVFLLSSGSWPRKELYLGIWALTAFWR